MLKILKRLFKTKYRVETVWKDNVPYYHLQEKHFLYPMWEQCYLELTPIVCHSLTEARAWQLALEHGGDM